MSKLASRTILQNYFYLKIDIIFLIYDSLLFKNYLNNIQVSCIIIFILVRKMMK